jgi:aminopeptidase YwaD
MPRDAVPSRGSGSAAALLALAVWAAASAALADERRIPFWTDDVPRALAAEVDGVSTLDTVRALGRFHRVHGSPGFAAAAEYMRARAEAAGLSEARIERLPADGQTSYAHFKSYLGWKAEQASLEEVTPRARVLSRFPDLPVALADYSQDADVTAELVDVGTGTRAEDYAGKEVSGRLVLASGALPLVHRLACLERGALGFLSDFPNQTTAFSGDDRDLVRWGHLSPYETRNRFAFMLSKRQAEDLRARLQGGETIRLRARVVARMVPATYDVVSAVLPGSDPTAGEVVLTAHLCHQSAGANDNASGSAAILEVGRALRAAVARGTLAAPRRTIRFLWLPEIAGAQAWLVRNPERAKSLVAGIHMDMVGGLLATTRGTFHLSRSAESLPHVINVVARAWFDDVVAASAQHAESGGDPRTGLVWAPGSREAFLGDVRPLEMGSDHEVFQEASFGVPMVYFHDWPDATIHTNKDLPENLDATKLGRVAYMGAGIAWTLSALPDAEVVRLVSMARGEAERRIADARERASLAADPADRPVIEREAAATGVALLRSVAALWPNGASAVRQAEAALVPAVPARPARKGGDPRVPLRNPAVRGPVSVYYYDHLAAVLGDTPGTALASRRNGERLAYECLNFVDGRRSVAEIRDLLSGRYEPLPEAEVAEYLGLLARAGVVSWR